MSFDSLEVFQHLGSGIRVTLQTAYQPLFSFVDPLLIFTRFDFQSLLNKALSYEMSYRSDIKQKQHRQSLNDRRGFRGFGVIPEYQLNTVSKLTLGSVLYPGETVLRDRGRLEVPISIYVWFVSIFLAFDFDARTRYLSLLSNECFVPSLTEQFFKKVRRSTCGVFEIIPSVASLGCKLFFAQRPDMISSFMDYDYIKTQPGMIEWITFCNNLNNIDSSYIKMVPATQVKNISLTSNWSTTFCSIHLCSDGTLKTLPYSDFKRTTVPAIHIADANVANLTLNEPYNDSTSGQDTTRPYVPYESFLYSCPLTDDSVAHHMVRRALGIDENSFDDKGKVNESPTTPPPNNGASSRRSTTFFSRTKKKNVDVNKNNVKDQKLLGTMEVSKSSDFATKFKKFVDDMMLNHIGKQIYIYSVA